MTLRVTRRGGWAWGPDPRGLLAAAVGALPRLIAECLRDLGPLHDETLFSGPLRLRVPVKLSA